MGSHHQAEVYDDGPPHGFPDRQVRDLAVHETREDYGYTVIRFAHDADGMERVWACPHVVGTPAPQRPAAAAGGEEAPGLDLDLFPQSQADGGPGKLARHAKRGGRILTRIPAE